MGDRRREKEDGTGTNRRPTAKSRGAGGSEQYCIGNLPADFLLILGGGKRSVAIAQTDRGGAALIIQPAP